MPCTEEIVFVRHAETQYLSYILNCHTDSTVTIEWEWRGIIKRAPLATVVTFDSIQQRRIQAGERPAPPESPEHSSSSEEESLADQDADAGSTKPTAAKNK